MKRKDPARGIVEYSDDGIILWDGTWMQIALPPGERKDAAEIVRAAIRYAVERDRAERRRPCASA